LSQPDADAGSYFISLPVSSLAFSLKSFLVADNWMFIKYDGLQYLMSGDSDVQSSDTMKKLEKERSKSGQEQEELVLEDVNLLSVKILKLKERKHLSDYRLVPKRKKVPIILTAVLQESNTIHW
jgi:hypothetical protein